MKILCLLVIILFSYSVTAQDGYPTPPSSPNRLFYIQHSNNQNTYVYDVNMNGTDIDQDDPVKAYRILYSSGGEKKSLTAIQRRLAYGIITDYTKPGYCELHLAASKELKFYLILTSDNNAKVYVTVNKHKFYLDNMFIKLKETGLSAKAEYILFTGKDFNNGSTVTEKLVMD